MWTKGTYKTNTITDRSGEKHTEQIATHKRFYQQRQNWVHERHIGEVENQMTGISTPDDLDLTCHQRRHLGEAENHLPRIGTQMMLT